MATVKHSRRKKPSFKDEPIDIGELSRMPNVEGVLGFLGRTPQEYKRLFHASEVEIPFPAPVEAAANTGVPGREANRGAPDLGAPDLGVVNAGASAVQGDYIHPGEGSGSNPEAVYTGAPNERAPELARSVIEAPESATAILGAPGLSSPLLGASGLDAPFLEAPESTAPGLSAPELGEAVTDLRRFVYKEAPRPRPWTTAQDGHTHAEQNLYQAMYSRGKPMAGSNTRGLVIGVRTLAKLVPMAYSNCHANLRSLIEKLAIEERPAQRYTDGRLFIIYTYDEILRRRRAAGLTHVLKRTRGVTLVNPGALNKGAPEVNSGAINQGAGAFNAGAPWLGNEGAPALGATIRNKESEVGTTSSIVTASILREFGFVDDDAIQTLIRKCRENAPDATNEEIAELGTTTAQRVVRMRNIDNPVGLLIEQTAKCFMGESFRMFRRAREEQQKRWDEFLSSTDNPHE
jgi:hypothetical protein